MNTGYGILVMVAYAMFVLASGKPANMSEPSEQRYGADQAVDGVYSANDEYDSLAHTNSIYRPWWRVDLQSIHCIKAVKILNRGGNSYKDRHRS